MKAELWECDDCAFGFDAVHVNSSGGYSCPVCAEVRLEAEVEELRSKLALLTGAYIFATGKRPVWPDARTLTFEPVDGEAPR